MTAPNYPPYPYPMGVDDESGPILPPWYVRGWTAQNNAYFPAPPQGDAGLNNFPLDQAFSSLRQNYYDGDSNPVGGYLTFWPSDAFTITENDITWRVPQRFLGTLTFPFDNAGVSPWAFSMEGSGKIYIWSGQLVVRLFNTDNPNLVTDSGNPLTYHVTEHLRGGRQFDITVPGSLSTAGLNPLYSQIVSESVQPFAFDPADPMGYLGASIDIPPSAVSGAYVSPLPIDEGGTNASTAAGALANLGAVPVEGGSMEGWLAPAVVILTDAPVISVNAALGNDFEVTLGGDRMIANPANPASGQMIEFVIQQDGTGGRTVTWGTAYDFGAAGIPPLSTVAGRTDIVAFKYRAAVSKWLCAGTATGF